MDRKIPFRYFLFFFFLIFLILNWEKILILFYPNYFLKAINYFVSRSKKIFEFEKVKKEDFQFTEKENSLEIPSLKIFIPLVLVKDESEIEKGLEKGAVLHPKSVFPPDPGRTIILGHSTRHRFPKEIAIFAFTYLPDLKKGDKVILNLNHKEYVYFVEKSFVAKEGEDLPSSKKENLLYLVTCWPPGRLVFKERFVVLAKMK